MTGKPCPEHCDCGRHHPIRMPAPVPYALTEKAESALALWDGWKAQREKETER